MSQLASPLTFQFFILITDGLDGVCIICSKNNSRIPIMERRMKDFLIWIIMIIVALIGFCTYIYCGGGNGHGCGRGHDGEGKGQLISKCIFGVFIFFQKTDKNKST